MPWRLFATFGDRRRWQCDVCGLKTAPTPYEPSKIIHSCPGHPIDTTKPVRDPNFDNATPRGVKDLACHFRGEVLGTHACEMCSQRGVLKEIYACSYVAPDGSRPHPTCTLRRWTARTTAIPPGEAICLLCPHRPNEVVTALCPRKNG